MNGQTIDLNNALCMLLAFLMFIQSHLFNIEKKITEM
jgi:hypothetical protein